MEKVFAYGSLLDTEIQQKLFGRVVPQKNRVVLKDWSLKTDKEYPYIVPNEGDQVEGYVLLLKLSELAAADNWEETPVAYLRQRVRVEMKPGKKFEVWSYVGAVR